VHHFHDINLCLPPSRLDKVGGVAWTVLILPYIEQGAFAGRWDTKRWYYDQGTTVADGDAIRAIRVPIFFCPTRRTANTDPALSIAGDTPDMPFGGSRNHYPGALGDYACSVGNDMSADFNGVGGNGRWCWPTSRPCIRSTRRRRGWGRGSRRRSLRRLPTG